MYLNSFSGSTLVIRAIRNVEKGKQISHCYGQFNAIHICRIWYFMVIIIRYDEITYLYILQLVHFRSYGLSNE